MPRSRQLVARSASNVEQAAALGVSMKLAQGCGRDQAQKGREGEGGRDDEDLISRGDSDES